jgi:hypothetical protein
MAISCTKEVDVQLEHLNIEKNVTITIKRFPPEPSASNYPWRREIFVYGTHADFLLKQNPIFHDFTPGMAKPSIVSINDIKKDVLYLRVTLWVQSAYKGSYYYNDSILIPDYDCNIQVITSTEKWEQE